MRIQTQLKVHEVHGSRLPYNPKLAEVRENEYVYLDADGIAVPDGEGILYWVDTIVTTDAGGAIVYDNNAASGRVLAGAYAAKADHGVPNSWDPPKKYEHGVYVDVDNSVVEICYRPYARNLRCRATIAFAPGTKNLVSRIVIRIPDVTRALVSRAIVRKQSTKSLVSRLTARPFASRALVSRTTVQQPFYVSNVVCQVSVLYAPGTSNVVAQVTVRKQGEKNLVCHLYADRTE